MNGMGRIDFELDLARLLHRAQPLFRRQPRRQAMGALLRQNRAGPKETYDARLAAGKHEHTGWTYTTKRAADRCNSR